jgi:hypothetical protein
MSHFGSIMHLMAYGPGGQINPSLRKAVSLSKIALSNPVVYSGVSEYSYDIPRTSDTVRPTHLIFEKLDNAPLNFALDIEIGGQLITSIPNEIIDTQSVKSELVNSNNNNDIQHVKYKIALPFDNIWRGNDIQYKNREGKCNFKCNGINHVASVYHTKKYKFRTTNKLDGVFIVQEDNYLDDEWRQYLAQNVHTQSIVQMAYTYGMSNTRIIQEHGGLVSGYYIHCRQPITNIEMWINGHSRHSLDSDLIDIQCHRVNAYTIYMPCSLDSQRFILNEAVALNHSRLDRVEFCITTPAELGSSQVCIVSEIHRELKYESGLAGITQGDFGTYTKNLVYIGNICTGNVLGNIPAIPLAIPPSDENGDRPECVISREPIEPGMEYAKCTQCVAVYTYDVMRVWWSQNKTCPYCRINMSSLVKYVNSEPDPDYLAPEPAPEPLKPWEIPGVAI